MLSDISLSLCCCVRQCLYPWVRYDILHPTHTVWRERGRGREKGREVEGEGGRERYKRRRKWVSERERGNNGGGKKGDRKERKGERVCWERERELVIDREEGERDITEDRGWEE